MAVIGLVLGGERASAAARVITVNGSDTMVILMRRWAQLYTELYPEVRIQVTGGGTGTGFAALINRTTDLCMASRRIRSYEVEACVKTFLRRPLEYAVALDGLIVYVNESNPLDALDLDQLAALFTGRIVNWSALAGPNQSVALYSRENSSGTYAFFKERGLHGQDFSARTQTMPGTAAVIEAVARDRGGIGYGGAAYIRGMRPLALRPTPGEIPVAPTGENISAGRYPIWRSLFLYVNPQLHRDDIASFLHWIRSDEGQRIVVEVGYYPLTDSQRARPVPGTGSDDGRH
jgi:phosphate transport system substrate-binding protein